MDIQEYLKLPYNYLVKPMQDESSVYFHASVLEFEGCQSTGKTVGEAYDKLMGAMEEWIEARLEAGLPIPPFWELSADPFYRESNIRHLEQRVKSISDGTAKLVEHELIEDEEDIALADEAYDEYLKSGKKSRPIEELWKELGL